MRILVTGGAGFIGSHVAEIYLGAGHEVWIVDDLSSGKRGNLPSGAHFVQADISDAAVRRLLVDERIEVVNHHAAQMDVRRSVADPLFDARVNILGLLNILEGARQARCQRIILRLPAGRSTENRTLFRQPKTIPPVRSVRMESASWPENGICIFTGESMAFRR